MKTVFGFEHKINWELVYLALGYWFITQHIIWILKTRQLTFWIFFPRLWMLKFMAALKFILKKGRLLKSPSGWLKKSNGLPGLRFIRSGLKKVPAPEKPRQLTFLLNSRTEYRPTISVLPLVKNFPLYSELHWSSSSKRPPSLCSVRPLVKNDPLDHLSKRPPSLCSVR